MLRGHELLEFMVELGSRFEEMNLSTEDINFLKTVEKEHGEEIITFSKLVSLLNSLGGTPAKFDSSYFWSDCSQQVEKLETKLSEKAQECDRLRKEVATLRDEGLALTSGSIDVMLMF